MGKPVAKKVKVEELKFDPKTIDELKAKEEAIKGSLEAEAVRLEEVKAEFRKNRVPLFNERNEIIKSLPGFWKQAVNNNLKHISKSVLYHLLNNENCSFSFFNF